MNKTTAESQAKELLKQETGVTRSYESLRKSFNGYSEFYMFKNKDKQHLTTSADLATMVQFARFDIILGTTMAELVHACCMQAPKKDYVEAIIGLDRRTNRAALVASLFDYKNKNGYNCLTSAFDLAVGYQHETGTWPNATTGLIPEINALVRYLVKLGDDHQLDMTRVLNHTSKNGSTVFHQASNISEQVALFLLNRGGVDVNTVNVNFMTPVFQVS